MRKVAFFLIAFLFLLSPFHAFLVTYVRSLHIGSLAELLFSALSEILVVMLVILLFVELIRKRRFPSFEKYWLPFFAFFLLALVLLFFQRDNLLQWIWGARYALLPFIFLIVLHAFHFADHQKKKLISVILWTALPVLLFGIIHSTVLPQNFLERFGYSYNREIWDVTTPISACQYLEHTQTFCRATSTFGGPTRYGTYLILIGSLAFTFLLRKVSSKEKIFLSFLLLLAFINIILTFSRSIWIGFVALVIIFLLIDPQSRKKLAPVFSGLGILLLLALIIGVSIFSEYLSTFFLRFSSTGEHFQAFEEGLRVFLANPFGLGLGTAGPASLRFEKLIPENWYLQIGIEMGVLGLALFVWILLRLLRGLYLKFKKSGDELSLACFLALASISIVSLFTHGFEETTTSLFLFGLVGLVSASPPRDHTHRLS